jgi:PAS domain S-box-containing protein
VILGVLLLESSEKLTFQSPELWVYLLGLSVLLVVALRRVMASQDPLKDEVYRRTVAVEHVQSGVVWVGSDGKISSVNASFATTLGGEPANIRGRDWYEIFAPRDRSKAEEAYSQMLLLGKANVEVHGRRLDGSYAALEVLMVAIHDHKMRFIGHHCLVLDRTRERILEAQLQELSKKLELHNSAAR